MKENRPWYTVWTKVAIAFVLGVCVVGGVPAALATITWTSEDSTAHMEGGDVLTVTADYAATETSTTTESTTETETETEPAVTETETVTDTVTNTETTTVVLPPPDPQPEPYDVTLTDQTWNCSQAYGTAADPYRVSVFISGAKDKNGDGQITSADRYDAVNFQSGCTGHLTVHATTRGWDVYKVGPGAHDIHCIDCTARIENKVGDVHQDALQAMGGKRIEFLHFRTSNAGQAGAHGGGGPGSGHSSFFVNMGSGGQELPEDIVCDGCHLDFGGTPVVNGDSNVLRSGIRGFSVVVKGVSGTCVQNNGTTPMINENTTCVDP
jgi:hypothetical protein